MPQRPSGEAGVFSVNQGICFSIIVRVECTLQCSQVLAISLYPEPVKSNPELHIIFVYDSFNVLPSKSVHSKRPSCFTFSVKIVYEFRFYPMLAVCARLTQLSIHFIARWAVPNLKLLIM
jgi:hypothetical protein